MWKRAYEALKSCGIAVFSPGQKQGKCVSPYVVLYDGGQAAGRTDRTAHAYLTAAVYVPAGQYSSLDTMKRQVASALRLGTITRTGEETAVTLDEDVNAIVLRMQFGAIKRNC